MGDAGIRLDRGMTGLESGVEIAYHYHLGLVAMMTGGM